MNYTHNMSKRIYFVTLIGVILLPGFVLYKKTVINSEKQRVTHHTQIVAGVGGNGPNKGTDVASNDKSLVVKNNKPDQIKIPVRAETLTSWSPPTVPDDMAHANQTDVKLINHIRDNWILPPFTGPRNLAQPKKVHFSQSGQSQYIDKLLNQKTNGFYIECGAASGEGLSNSLFFEKSRNWTGILIEANPWSFKKILSIRRHAYMMNACLSPSKQPMVLDFRRAGFIGGLTDFMEEGHKSRVVHENGEAAPTKIQCFPLPAILKAMNINHVDYFSLDIEGAEFEILKHFPFDEINVDILTIEYFVSGGGDLTRKKLKHITDLMIGKYRYKKATYQDPVDIMLTKGV